MERYEALARELRKQLHLLPEPSMREVKTKRFLMEFIQTETALKAVDCGSWFYAKWQGKSEKALCIRADFDAVTDADGVSRHLCGHDGHSAALAAFAKWISDEKPEKTIILLFQPGEESGEGAKECCKLFERENIGEIYGFHNIPGHPAGQVLLKRGTFACASTGLELCFAGKTTHAAYPENGVDPTEAIARLVLETKEYVRRPHRGMVLSTVIGITAGSASYGVAASLGALRLTVRAEYREEFAALTGFIEQRQQALAAEYGLEVSFRKVEEFPSTENHAQAVERLDALCAAHGLDRVYLDDPFRWSEDFGHYLLRCPGAMFGVGAGEECAPLHTQNYEFNDALFGSVLRLYRALAQ